jgi:hypothetical protein
MLPGMWCIWIRYDSCSQETAKLLKVHGSSDDNIDRFFKQFAKSAVSCEDEKFSQSNQLLVAKPLKAPVDHGENVHAGVEKVVGLKGAYLIKIGVQCLLVVVLGRAPHLARLRLHHLLPRLPQLLLLPRLHRFRHLCSKRK